MKKVLGIWFALVFLASFLFLFPLFLLFLQHPKTYILANNLRKLWARIILFFTFSGIEIQKESGLEYLPKNAIYVANHSSYLDILCMALVVPKNYLFMAKIELAQIPLFGIFFHTVDIAVNRKSITESAKAFNKSMQRQQKGYSIILFPEGTIGEQVPNLKSFKAGAAKLAIDCQCPIVPVTLFNNWQILPDKKGLEFNPKKMKVFVHRPIDTKGLNKENIHALNLEIFSIIENKLIEHNIIKIQNAQT
jgi:1-acyl-sn-glycerol-3-phosphate acyltransferase